VAKSSKIFTADDVKSAVPKRLILGKNFQHWLLEANDLQLVLLLFCILLIAEFSYGPDLWDTLYISLLNTSPQISTNKFSVLKYPLSSTVYKEPKR
jgi:hypothetical protein